MNVSILYIQNNNEHLISSDIAFSNAHEQVNMFKIPSNAEFKKKSSDLIRDKNIPTFDYESVIINKEIGRGSFGTVYNVTYKNNVHVVKVFHDVTDVEMNKKIVKEAKLM